MKKIAVLALFALLSGCSPVEASTSEVLITRVKMTKPAVKKVRRAKISKPEAAMVVEQLENYKTIQAAPLTLRLNTVEILEDHSGRRYLPAKVTGEVEIGSIKRVVSADIKATTHRKAEPTVGFRNRFEVLAIYRDAKNKQQNVQAAIGWQPFHFGKVTTHLVLNADIVGAAVGLEVRRGWNILIGRGPSFEQKRYQNFVGLSRDF